MSRIPSLSHPLFLLAVLVAGLLGAGTIPSHAGGGSPTPPAGASSPATFLTLHVGGTTYREAKVLSQDARSVFFLHSGGVASARLRNLPPEVQARLGFDPLTAPPEPATPAPGPALATRPILAERILSANQRLQRLANAFGTTPNLGPVVSLQADFARLDLKVKSQGRRPSCSVYSMVSALEYQYFQLHGRADDFSEEYLVWATRRIMGMVGNNGLPARNAMGEPITDSGFPLLAVAQAISVYGVALEAEMPARLRPSRDSAAVPDRTLIDLSRQRRGIFIGEIPGADTLTLLNNIVHVLNAGVPVPAGIRWADDAQSRAGMLDKQPPLADGGHAITFVGYESPSCSPATTVFIFKNSYGVNWGRGGYGRVTWSYLEKNLLNAYVLDVRALPPEATNRR